MLQNKRIKLKCLKELYPYHQDVDCVDDDVYEPLSYYGVTKERWKNWHRSPHFDYNDILNVDEIKKLVSDYTKKKQMKNPVNLFDSVCSFYKSESFKSHINYSKLLNQQNYWFWRQHFIEETPIPDDEENSNDPYSVKLRHRHAILDSNENPQWWKYQVILSTGNYLFPATNDEVEEEEEDKVDDDDDDSPINNIFFNFDSSSSVEDQQRQQEQQNINNNDNNNNNNNHNHNFDSDAEYQQQEQQNINNNDNNNDVIDYSSDNYNEVFAEEEKAMEFAETER